MQTGRWRMMFGGKESSRVRRRHRTSVCSPERDLYRRVVPKTQVSFELTDSWFPTGIEPDTRVGCANISLIKISWQSIIVFEVPYSGPTRWTHRQYTALKISLIYTLPNKYTYPQHRIVQKRLNMNTFELLRQKKSSPVSKITMSTVIHVHTNSEFITDTYEHIYFQRDVYSSWTCALTFNTGNCGTNKPSAMERWK